MRWDGLAHTARFDRIGAASLGTARPPEEGHPSLAADRPERTAPVGKGPALVTRGAEGGPVEHGGRDRLEEQLREPACKPGSVGGSHSSGTHVAVRL